MNRDVKLCAEYVIHSAKAFGPILPPQMERYLAAAKRLAAPKKKPTPRVAAPRNRTKQAARESRPERVAAIREAVFARAEGRCEAWFPHLSASENLNGARCEGVAVVMDHWLGGSGRRRAEESVSTCWALCEDCNRLRTANHPSLDHWNRAFEEHCIKHGYRFTPHYDARAAARSRATP